LDTQAEYKFILFVAGMSHKSLRAIENFKKIGQEYLGDVYDLQIIDLNVEREQAMHFQIIAVPTLIKTAPFPPRVIVGDLSETKKVLKILDLE
jgi:circadian clock protein KaiB